MPAQIKFSPNNGAYTSPYNTISANNTLGSWTKKAYEELRKKNLQYFPACTFQRSDLKLMIDQYLQGPPIRSNGTLTFTLVYCKDASNNEKLSVLAHIRNQNGPFLEKTIYLSGDLNPTFTNINDLDIIDVQLRILKKMNGVSYLPPTLEFYEGKAMSSSLMLKDWLNQFKLNEATIAYPDQANVGGAWKDIETLKVFFDISKLKSTYDPINDGSFEKIALIPIILYTAGEEEDSASRGDYLTYILAPIDSSGNVILLPKTGSTTKYFIASGCPYPRPWEVKSACTSEANMKIKGFPIKV